MHPTSPVSAIAVKKEEKEEKLKEFIAAHLAATAGERADAGRTALLVARSYESPVLLALAAFQSELAARGIAVCAVLATGGGDVAGETGPQMAGWSIKRLSDLRLREAHEQLVLGPETAWIGDCMRREPAKRDAFESYAAACPLTASNALRSFRHLWQAAIPLSAAERRGLGDGSRASAATCAAAALLADPSAEAGDGPTALTRQ